MSCHKRTIISESEQSVTSHEYEGYQTLHIREYKKKMVDTNFKKYRVVWSEKVQLKQNVTLLFILYEHLIS